CMVVGPRQTAAHLAGCEDGARARVLRILPVELPRFSRIALRQRELGAPDPLPQSYLGARAWSFRVQKESHGGAIGGTRGELLRRALRIRPRNVPARRQRPAGRHLGVWQRRELRSLSVIQRRGGSAPGRFAA